MLSAEGGVVSREAPSGTPPIAWATADTCQLVVAGADLAAAIVDSGLRVVVWRLGGGLLHRILFPERIAQLAMQVREADPSRATLWAVSADGAVFEQQLVLDGAASTRLERARTLPLTQVHQVACGEGHALALAAERVVTWSATAPTPTPLELPPQWRRDAWRVALVAAGGGASACVLAQLQPPRRGRYLETAVLSWGEGPHLGRATNGPDAAPAAEPAEVEGLRGLQVDPAVWLDTSSGRVARAPLALSVRLYLPWLCAPWPYLLLRVVRLSLGLDLLWLYYYAGGAAEPWADTRGGDHPRRPRL